MKRIWIAPAGPCTKWLLVCRSLWVSPGTPVGLMTWGLVLNKFWYLLSIPNAGGRSRLCPIYKMSALCFESHRHAFVLPICPQTQIRFVFGWLPASILYFLWSISRTSSLLWLAQVTGGILTIVSEENVGSSVQSTAFLLSFCPIFSGFESKEWGWHQLYKNKCYKSVASGSIEVHSI